MLWKKMKLQSWRKYLNCSCSSQIRSHASHPRSTFFWVFSFAASCSHLSVNHLFSCSRLQELHRLHKVFITTSSFLKNDIKAVPEPLAQNLNCWECFMKWILVTYFRLYKRLRRDIMVWIVTPLWSLRTVQKTLRIKDHWEIAFNYAL